MSVCACGCGRPLGRARARRLRSACYSRAQHAGSLVDYPRLTRAGQDVVEDVTILLPARGVEATAAALGMTAGGVAAACRRHGRPDLALPFERLQGKRNRERQRGR